MLQCPTATADGHPLELGGGETLHHELPISTVRVSDKKSVRVRRCRLGGIWRALRWPDAPNAQFADLANKWQKFAMTRRHVSSPSMNSPTLKMNGPTPKKVSRRRALRGRLINKKRVRRQSTRAARELRGRATSPKGSNPFAPFARQNPRAVAHRTPVKLRQNPHFQRG